MADTHETVADIIAWLRKPREGENAYLTLWRDEIADRLEAALKREIDELKKQVADLQQQLPKPDPNWRDICAKCFKNGATEPPDCEYYTEDGCMSPIPDQHPLIQVGNAAKLREALETVRKYVKETTPAKVMLGVIEVWCDEALAAPPRNCDVGAAEEQEG